MDPPRTTLCPGYTQVTTFSPSLSSPKSKAVAIDPDSTTFHSDGEAEDDEGEYEEDVEYVVLDLGNIEPTLVPSSSSYCLIGLDTPTPFLQLSGTIFQGRHENLLGSELIFTDDKEPGTATSGQKKRGVTHVSTTSKRITFKEVQLRPKDRSAVTNQPQALEDDLVLEGEEVPKDGEDAEVDDDNQRVFVA